MRIGQAVKLKNWIDSLKDSKIPVKISFQLIRLSDILDRDCKIYFNKLAEILNQYCEKDEKGNPKQTTEGAIIIQEEYRQECQKMLFELESIEIENPNITICSLNDIENFVMTLEEMQLIYPFILENKKES